MTTSAINTTSPCAPTSDKHDSRIEELLDRWEEAEETIPLEALCASKPDLLPMVRARIDRLKSIDERLGCGPPSFDLADVILDLHTSVGELEFLNRGGLGAVYVGEDSRAHRPVAIKFLHEHLATTEEARARFALEAEVTARLEHPGVIPLYGVGQTEEDRPFYAMRFIDGQSMDELITSLYKPDLQQNNTEFYHGHVFRGLLSSFVSVCKTIAYAHNRGIVHRDIKPANVMLGKYGETIVVDWGLAVPFIRSEPFRQSGEQSLVPVLHDESASGYGAGTPAYMSPEQASSLAPAPASDIYSLGATLHKILCGKPPVDGRSAVELKQRIIEGRIDDIRARRSALPQALVAICRKAMALHPSDRYGTALELAADIERFLADETVEAFDEPWLRKVARLARRHRVATQTAVFSLFGCLVVAALSIFSLGAYASREHELRTDAQRARQQAEQSQQQSLATSAQYLSQSIANEIDLRWRILEAESASPVLRRFVTQLAELHQTGSAMDPDTMSPRQAAELRGFQEDIQRWLERRFIANRNAVQTSSWFVNAVEGTQVARVPAASSIGKNFRHRDYFNGIGYDLDPNSGLSQPLGTGEQAIRVGPLSDRQVHMSAAYESSNTKTLKLAFTVPIYDKEVERHDRRRIGVLGMSVEFGSFPVAPNAWLIDTRPDQFNQQRGLVLQHPRLHPRSRDDFLPHISSDVVDHALELRSIRRQMKDRFFDAMTNPLITANDPIEGVPMLIAVDPVFVHGREPGVADTGWVVVVSEPAVDHSDQ